MRYRPSTEAFALFQAAANLEFELAVRLRDEVKKLRDVEIGLGVEKVMGPAD